MPSGTGSATVTAWPGPGGWRWSCAAGACPRPGALSLWLPDATGALRAVTPDAETGAPVAPVAPLRRTG